MPTTLAAATPFPIPDDGENPVTLTRAWLTNVMTTESGQEQRAALRAMPRRTLSYTAMFEDAAKAGQFKALLAAAPERLRFIVPLWPRYAVPTSFPDASTIDGEFADRGFVAGAQGAMLWQSESLWELVDVETVADDALALSTPIGGTYEIGPVRVIPVMTAWLEPPTLEQLAIDSERVPLTFIEEIPGVAGIDPTKGASATPVAATITSERLVGSSEWGPNHATAYRVTVFDATGMPIPRAPLTWTLTPHYPDDPGFYTFPGDGNTLAANYPGNTFANFFVHVESGAASLEFLA